jgi:hypothetical protein
LPASPAPPASAQFTASAPLPSPPGTTKNDYADDKAWLCRSGRQDACSIDHTTYESSRPTGKLTRETWATNLNAPIDCFYVYPTISTDAGPYSDMSADPAELNVIRQQFARFGSKCRVFAPLYRQVTLAALTCAASPRAAQPVRLDAGLGYDDVRDA